MQWRNLKWIAVYQDDSIHTEDELEDSKLIDRDQLKRFFLNDGDKTVFVACFDDTRKRKLIFRRRTYLDMNGTPKGVVYLVGWHENVKGVSVKSICYVFVDYEGNVKVEFGDDRNDLELVPCEQFEEIK